MKCEHCGYAFEGITYPPYCPFCQTSQKTPAEVTDALEKAERYRRDRQLATAAEWYKTAADAGSVEGAALYANALENGIGCKKNLARATAYHQFAADRGNAASAAALGRILLSTYGDAKKDEAMFWFLCAAEAGDATASYYLALDCADTDEKLYRFTAAALGGNETAALAAAKWLDTKNSEASLVKGFLSLAGKETVRAPLLFAKHLRVKGVEPTLPERDERAALCRVAHRAAQKGKDFLATSFFGRATALGDGGAATRIGNFFATGRSVPQSQANAGKWYLRAIELGDVSAMVSLGEMCLHGNGTERDPEKALALFRRCASLGDPKAQYLCAELYFEGADVKRDLPMALSLYEQSAAQGYPPAVEKQSRICAAVAATYNKGNDAFKSGDYDAAFRSFTLAAEMGHASAIANLGTCYQNGYGCKKDMKRALALYRRAVVFGKASAKYNLGLCYLRNYGIRFDADRAEELLLGSGHPEAEKLVADMRARKKKKEGQRLYAMATVLYRRGDTVEALRARTLAASLGVANAMCVLGCHYEFGAGVARDMDKARRFYMQSGLSPQGIDRLKRGFLKSTVAQSNYRIK